MCSGLLKIVIMKKSLLLFCLFTSLVLSHSLAQMTQHSLETKTTYTNPLQVQFGDPYVLYSQETYYMYGTGGGAKKGFAAYSSKDLVNWKPEGQVYFHDNRNGWSDPKAGWGGAYWAPEVYEVNGKFYMVYSAQWRVNPTQEVENFRIGVAVADKPTGPFIDLANKPIFDPGYPIIDANVFFDTNGKAYLYFSRCCYKHPVESEVADLARKKGGSRKLKKAGCTALNSNPIFPASLANRFYY